MVFLSVWIRARRRGGNRRSCILDDPCLSPLHPSDFGLDFSPGTNCRPFKFIHSPPTIAFFQPFNRPKFSIFIGRDPS